jgi:hypothetical protein
VIGLPAVLSASAQDGVEETSVGRAVRVSGEREGIVAPIRREVGSIRALLNGLEDEEFGSECVQRGHRAETLTGDLRCRAQ